MEYILTAAEMKKCDETTSLTYGIPSLVLMEKASMAVVEEIKQGFDLKTYSGMRVKRWTYSVKNYPGHENKNYIIKIS